MATDPVRWTCGPHNSWLVRFVTYAPHGLLGGVALWLAVGVAALAANGAVSGSTVALLLIVVLVGGPMSLLYAWWIASYGANGSRWVGKLVGTDQLTGRGLAVATVLGAFAIAGGITISPRLLAAALVVAVLLSVFGSSLAVAVELDPVAGRLRVGPESRFAGATAVDLADATGAWHLSLGPPSAWRVTVLRRIAGPPLIVPIPKRRVAAFDRALERGLAAAPASEPATASTTRPMRIALAAIGLGFLGLAVGFGALVVQTGQTAGGRVFYPIVLLATFAAIALGYAGYESWLARRAASTSDR